MTRTRRQTAMTLQGWRYVLVVGLILAGAMLREVNLLMVLAGMLIGPLVLSRPLALMTLHGLTVRRKLPQGVCAGDLLVAGVTVTNTRKHLGSWAVVVEEPIHREGNGAQQPAADVGLVAQGVRVLRYALRLLPQLRRDDETLASHAGVYFSYVPANQSRKGVCRGRLTERGRYRLGPMRVSTRFPFGLFCGSMEFGRTDTLVVFPRLGRLTQSWLARHRESFAGTDRRERRAGSEGDFYGVRPWRNGDNRRWIHWRTSARTGKLAVRQFEQPRNRDVAVLVDLWQPRPARPEHRENVELAVSFAATVAADLCRKGGSSVYLGTMNAEPEFRGGPSSAPLLQDLMERLAVAEAQAQDRLAELLEAALARVEPGTEIVLVTTRAISLADCSQLAPLRADPGRQARLRRVRVVDTSSETLAQYFQVE